MADTVTIKVDRCTMTLNLNPFFDDSTLVNIKKVFALIAQEPKRNEETIKVLHDYFPHRVIELHKCYIKADLDFVNGRGDEIAVKKAKRAYSRYIKIAEYYREYARKKYNF